MTAAFAPLCSALIRLLFAAALVWPAGPARSAAGQPRNDLFGTESALENGGFEKGSDRAIPRWQKVWPPFADREPLFRHVAKGAHGGRSCASIETFHQGGYTSWTQRIERPPEGATVVHLEGWIRFDDSGEGGRARASLLMLFSGSGMRDDGAVLSTPWIDSSTREWTRVEHDMVVPEGAEKWMVRCGVTGKARVFFDDIRVTWSTKKAKWSTAVLVETSGRYQVRAAASARKAWAMVSIPFPYMGQTPLAIGVRSEPEKAIDRLEIVKDRENRFLKVWFEGMKPGDGIRFDVRTLVLVRDRPLPDGKGIALAGRGKVPKEVKPFLEPSDGLETEDETIRKIAGRFDRTDLASMMAGLTGYLRENMEYEPGGDQGARASIVSKRAVCTGFANAAAALLIAAGVPTRILACTQTEGELQEHYIVEAWTRELGWSRCESTMAEFPWADTRNVILRVIYPDASRTSGNVPIFMESGGGVIMGADMGGSNGCWQSAATLRSLIVRAEDLAPLEELLRKAFEKAAKKAVRGSSISFIPKAAKMRGIDDGIKDLMKEMEGRLSRESRQAK